MSKVLKEFDSTIILREKIENTERKFGSVKAYYPVIVIDNGRQNPALFTEHEIKVAMARANSNLEDITEEKSKTLWEILFG